MSRPDRFLVGRMGLQLALAFVGVALAAVMVGLLVFSLDIGSDFHRLLTQQHGDLAGSVANAAGAAYDHVGWARADLNPVIALTKGTGAGIEIEDRARHVVRASPGFASIAVHTLVTSRPVLVRGKRVGWVVFASGHGRLHHLIAAFIAQGWTGRIMAGVLAVLIALLVAVPLSRRLTAPVDKLIWAARARERGDATARVGSVRGLGQLNDLAAAFDEMADSKEEQDQLRRNLVADVAHELRTPIAVLQAGHEAMLDGFTAPTSEHLGSLRDEVLRLARMVDDLQRLAAAEAAAMQLTLVRRDLAAVAATAATSLVDSFEAGGVTLVERLAKVHVMCDPLRMHEVVANLLTNALKFTPAGGQVTLQTEQCDTVGKLRVSDTGIGIPPDELPHVAERFYRGHQSSEVAGSGIGLTIVAELVRAHFGMLNIASEPAHGTTVTITLPLARCTEITQRSHGPRPGSRRRHAGIITNVGGGHA